VTEGTAWATLTFALLVAWPLHNLVLATFAWRRPQECRTQVRPRADPLEFWIVVPALNEERVVGATVRAALALDAPETPVRVLVVDDASDDGTPGILADIHDARLQVLRRELPGARKGKGEALNAAFRWIRRSAMAEGTVGRTVLGVIDGDGRGTPGMLREVAEHFVDASVGAVQCRVRIHNRDRLLGFLQDLEFGCVADASQGLRDVLGSVDLGGNGQFVRLTALMHFGDVPWSCCLVEDLELSLRMHLDGAKIRYARRATITQQGLVDLRRLVRQRTRWGQGNLQCVRFVPKLVVSEHVSPLALLDFLHYLLVPWLVAPLSVAVPSLIVVSAYGGQTGERIGGLAAIGDAFPLAAGIWASAAFLPGLVWGLVHRFRCGDEPLPRTLLAGLAYPVFLLAGVVASWRALFRYTCGRKVWAKTERLTEDVAPAILPVRG
jgi:cellulose synthase/poly-beta-1,6-N-acetylglucosamine synthase-like glycosyltransferase